MNNTIFLDVMPCSLCKNRRFGGTYHLYHQGEKHQQARNNFSNNIDKELPNLYPSPNITYFMLLNPSWQASSFAAAQEFPSTLQKPEAHYNVQKNPPIPSDLYAISLQLYFLRRGVDGTRPNSQAGGPPLLTVRDCLFSIFAATHHSWRPSSPLATWGYAMPWWQGTSLACLDA
jgi:hypothetical protein